MILYGANLENLPDNALYALQATPFVTPTLPWATLVGQAYGAPSFMGAAPAIVTDHLFQSTYVRSLLSGGSRFYRRFRSYGAQLFAGSEAGKTM